MEKEIKTCQNCKGEFTIEPEDFVFYDKIKVPPPTFCWQCRHQRRLSFRNEGTFYKRDCDLCKKSVVSRVSPDKRYKMYCTNCWFSENWEPENYAQEYDFSRPFFEQWKELFFNVPHMSIYNSNSVNSDWVNQETDDKNCYLNVGGHYNEDSAYNTYEIQGKKCFDNYWVFSGNSCSNNIKCDRSYLTHFSFECNDCLDTFYSYDCRNCSNIVGCAGLRNKQYCIFNQQYTKDSYDKFLKEKTLSSYKFKKWWEDESRKIWNNSPHRENTIFKAIDSSGNDLVEAKNSHNCWQGTKLENCKNMFISGWSRDTYDCSCGGAMELCYEIAHSGGAYNSKALLFSITNDPLKNVTINNVEYSAMTVGSSYCFGCVGVRSGEYMILNRRYTKEEYQEMLPKIKQHMNDMPYIDKKGRVYKYGEFFPSEFSPFGYNETTALEFIPLTRDEAQEQGFIWNDYTSDTQYEFSDYEIPDDIRDVEDDILEKVLKCEDTGKAYKIISMELSFCRQAGIPIARKCPTKRHKDRIAQLPLSCELYTRNCDNCKKDIQTPYKENCPELVYCVDCYQKEVL